MLGFALAAVGMDTRHRPAAPDLRLDRAAARLRLPDRGDRPVRHRRDPADDGGGAGLQGQDAPRSTRKVVLADLEAAAALLGDRRCAAALVGCWMGITPGGATPASFMSYGLAKRFSQQRRQVRHGRDRGRGRARDRGARRRHQRAAADADARHPRLADRGRAARRPADLGPAARARCCSSSRRISSGA